MGHIFSKLTTGKTMSPKYLPGEKFWDCWGLTSYSLDVLLTGRTDASDFIIRTMLRYGNESDNISNNN